MPLRSLIKIGLSLLLLSFVLVGITYNLLKTYGTASPTSTAGRTLSNETRKIDAMVTSLDLNGPIDLVLRQGPVPSLRVHGEQRSLANIETLQDGRDLTIRTKGMLLNPRHRLQVELVLPQLSELILRGNGNAKVSGFNGERMELQLNGSGNAAFNGRYRRLEASVRGSGELDLNAGNSEYVELDMRGSGRITASGSCKTMVANLNGSGDLDARHLAADKVDATVRGSGTGRVFARNWVEVMLNGSGNMHVYGSPGDRTVTRNGSGSVHWE